MSIRKTIKNLIPALIVYALSMPIFGAQGLFEGTIAKTHTAVEILTDGTENEFVAIEGEKVQVLDQIDGFYQVFIDSGNVIYVEKQYVNLEKPYPVEEEKEEVKETSKANDLITYGKQFIGTPYVYGGNSLTNGVDCSGFTKGVFESIGIDLQRRSSDQFAQDGKAISKNELEPGDLVFYGYDGRVTHVSIYIGEGQVLHASTSRGVVIDALDLNGMPPFIGYKRVL